MAEKPAPITWDMLNLRPPSSRRRPPFFKTKKVACVGMTQSCAFTPWDDPSWTIAAHPCTHTQLGRAPDWWFDLHPPSCFKGRKNWNRDYFKWLRYLRQPIFMQEDWPEIPMAVRYPKERIMGEFRAYFTNHVAWMIALAMTEGATHIGVFGCEYAAEQERGAQRGSLEYWLGMFEGAGGHVILPPGSRLLNKPAELYGYESHDPKTGRIIPSYLPVKAKTLSPKDAVSVELAVVDMTKADGRPKLMEIPETPIAWERSGHRIQA